MDIKLGRIFCQFGAETIDAPPNTLASHSYTFIYNPFTHTGVMGTLQLTQTLSVQLGAMLGPDVFIDPAASPYGMFTVKWAKPDGSDSLQLSGVLGSGRYDEAEQFNNPNIVDLVYVHAFSPCVTYTLDALFGWQTNLPDVGTATWIGVVNYLTLKFTPQLSQTTRVEFFNDADGNRTGFAGLYTTVTAGCNYQPCNSFIIRPEVRYDYHGDARPFEDKRGLFTACLDLIVRW